MLVVGWYQTPERALHTSTLSKSTYQESGTGVALGSTEKGSRNPRLEFLSVRGN